MGPVLDQGIFRGIIIDAYGEGQPATLEDGQAIPYPDNLVQSSLNQDKARAVAGDVGGVLRQDIHDADLVRYVTALVDEIDLVRDLVARRKRIGFIRILVETDLQVRHRPRPGCRCGRRH